MATDNFTLESVSKMFKEVYGDKLDLLFETEEERQHKRIIKELGELINE